MTRVLLAGVLTLFCLAGPATAADGSPEAPDDPGRLLLVLDASGSMDEPAAGGERKIDAARKALRAMVAALPATQEVGLRVYGATVFSADEPGACTDSQRVVDVATDNRDALLDAVADYAPYGETPIGHALREAGKDLGRAGNRTIVLVSDGEPTCAPDPCKVAEELAADGIGLRVDVVGLDVAGPARDKLRCIADAGGGSYVDAGDAADLTDSLVDAQTRASRPFDFTGDPVQGTDTPTGAPAVATGQYLDRLPATGSLFYRVPRTVPGSTIHAGIGYRGQAGTTGAVIDLYLRAEGTAVECARAVGYGGSVGARAPITYVGGTSWKPDPAAPCNTADEVVVEIAPQPTAAVLAGEPVELAIYEEPPLADPAAGAGSAPLEPQWSPLRSAAGDTADVVPGTSIANAPVVEDGSYALDINPGETQVLAVPLGWGQDVQVQLDATITEAVAAAGAVGSALDVEIMGPTRASGAVDFYGSAPAGWTAAALGNLRAGDRFRTGAQSAVVDYAHRESPDSRVRGAAVAGLRYVTVGFDVRGDVANLPYVLTVRTNGAPGEPPAYAAATDEGAPVPPDAASPLTLAPEAPDPAPEEEGRSASPADDGSPGWVLPTALAGGGLVLAALVFGLVLARRSRARRG